MTRLPEFKQAEIDKLRAELDHCRNSLARSIDTSNHWSFAHADAYRRGLAAGRAEALQEVMSDTETFDYRLGYAAALELAAGRPTIVCLCGSTRFKDEFVKANLRETLNGKIVLTIGCDMRTDDEIFGHMPPDELERVKTALDALHFRKVELADEVLILNVGGYVGKSTTNELRHAQGLGKRIRWLEPQHALAAAPADGKETG